MFYLKTCHLDVMLNFNLLEESKINYLFFLLINFLILASKDFDNILLFFLLNNFLLKIHSFIPYLK